VSNKSLTNHEKEIVTLLQEKKQKGIDLLYKNYGNYLFGIISKIVPRYDYAEIVLQDTFLKVWNNINKFDNQKGIFKTWIVSIARNTSIDKLRSKHYRHSQRFLNLENIPNEKEAVLHNTLLDDIDIQNSLLKLDNKYSEIIELKYFEGYTIKETAEILNLPLGTVKSRIRKGYLEMRKLIHA